MEIWIIGGIIVALMVYASTKIKRAAASAYEREVIETDRFSIIKPDGFIFPVGSPYVFEAYTKDFGEAEEAEEIRRGYATVIIGDTTEPDSVTETERSENGAALREFRKVLSRDGRSYELTIVILDEYFGDLESGVNEMLGSFAVK
jgi:hypothetical protein